MLPKITDFVKGPWAVAILLVGLGVLLSAGSASYSNAQPAVRVTSPASINTNNSCIPMMERVHGTITGRISCASDAQVREFCVELLRGTTEEVRAAATPKAPTQ